MKVCYCIKNDAVSIKVAMTIQKQLLEGNMQMMMPARK